MTLVITSAITALSIVVFLVGLDIVSTLREIELALTEVRDAIEARGSK